MFKVLLVDDHDLTLLCQKILWKSRFSVVPDVAKNGQEALLALKEYNYDFIIVDYEMYGMRGDELIKKIRKMEEYYSKPIIVLSNYAVDDFAVSCICAGADDYILKPIEEETYFMYINKYLNGEDIKKAVNLN